MRSKQQTPRNRNSAAGERGQSADGRPEKPKVARRANIPPRRTWLTFLILLLINYLLMRFLFPGPGEPVTIPYTAFKEEVAKGNEGDLQPRSEHRGPFCGAGRLAAERRQRRSVRLPAPAQT